MTRNEYLAELRMRLNRLSQEELESAIEFYTEYFEEVGDDAAAAERLGPPSRVASQILAELAAQELSRTPASPYCHPPADNSPVLGQNPNMPSGGFPNYAPKPEGGDAPGPGRPGREERPEQRDGEKRRPPVQPAEPAGTGAPGADTPPRQQQEDAPQPAPERGEPDVDRANPGTQTPFTSPYTTPQGRRSGLSAIWYVIVGILALPVALPVALVAILMIIGLVVLCFALVAGFFAVIVALIAGALVSLLSLFKGGGALTVGAALMLLGLALILIPLLVWFVLWLTGAVGKVSARLFQKLKGRAEDEKRQ